MLNKRGEYMGFLKHCLPAISFSRPLNEFILFRFSIVLLNENGSRLVRKNAMPSPKRTVIPERTKTALFALRIP